MKKLSTAVESRLRKKKISIVDYIFRLREGRGLTITQMADKMGVKTSYLSRILSGLGTNVTLETIAKCEDALDAEIIVCPGEYEEQLIDNPQRLWLIFSTALKTESGDELCREAARNSRVRSAVLMGVYVPPETLFFKYGYPARKKNPSPFRVNESEKTTLPALANA